MLLGLLILDDELFLKVEFLYLSHVLVIGEAAEDVFLVFFKVTNPYSNTRPNSILSTIFRLLSNSLLLIIDKLTCVGESV